MFYEFLTLVNVIVVAFGFLVIGLTLTVFLTVVLALLPLVWAPVLLAIGVNSYFGVSFWGFAMHITTIGLFSDAREFVVVVCEGIVQWCELRLSVKAAVAPRRIFGFIRDLYDASLPRRLVMALGMFFYLAAWIISSAFIKVASGRMSSLVWMIFLWMIFSGFTLTPGQVHTFVLPDLGATPLVVGLYQFSRSLVQRMREGRRFRRMSLALLLMWIVNIAYYSGLLVARHRTGSKKFTKAKILRSMSMSFARFVDGVRLPQVFRSGFEAGFTSEEVNQIESSIDSYLDWLRGIGYPVAPEISEVEPMSEIAGGQYDPNWLIAGSSWRVHAPQLQAFAQPEFRKFQHLVQEYRPTMEYHTLDNQLASIARYFYHPENTFPEPEDVLDIVWDVVKSIYERSTITPSSYIYHKWNKKFNVGVYATSAKKNRSGGMKKLSRREWISTLGGPRAVISVFDNFARFALMFDTHAQFFTKVEWLKPSKWMNDIVRTPVAAMLPEYVVQMMVSADPNKRFEYLKTPIKLGMPIKHATFQRIWQAHSRFKKHFAGDCKGFDSTIVGPVIRLIKAVRLKGFESHKDYTRIEKVIDRIYSVIEHGKLVSSNSGNIYRKGSGLMTGHASTSPDNSLVMTALYLVAWKTLTGRSAQEFRHYNELSVYGDDHVLSISEMAPPVWNWNNIVLTMDSWGVSMYEEVDSGGKGLPLHAIPFLKKFGRTPTLLDKTEFREVFGDEAPLPEFVTVHDHGALLGKAMAPMTNRNPHYRAKRIQSFMYLCAHDKVAYETLHWGLEAIFNSHPGIRADIGRYTPSYAKVMTVWYTSSIPLDVVDTDDESMLVAGSDAIILYGEVSVFERLGSMISLIPDLVNPSLRNIGPIEYMMRTFAPLLSWPKALIAQTNSCSAKGHVEALVSNSPYDFLSKAVPYSSQANYTTLIVRHWVFMALQQTRNYSFAYYITGFFSKIISGNFILNGFVAQARPKFAISYWNFALIVILNWLRLPSIPAFEQAMKKIRLPDIVGFFDDLQSSISAYLLHQIPTSFQDLALAFPHHNQMVASAPTGSGKSTSMIYMLSTISNAPRVYIIVPRVNLAVGLATYLRGQFPWEVGYVTGEVSDNVDARVIFITHGSFLARTASLFGQGNLFVVDEFHVQEILQEAANGVLLRSAEKVVFTSATPLTEGFQHLVRVDLTVTRTYSYERSETSIPIVDVFGSYLSKCLEISRAHNPWMIHLVFVDSFPEMDYLAQHLPGRVGTISSRGVSIDPSDMWILATSTADVGVTIPNVDVVVTRNFHFSVGPSGRGYYALPESLITQRAGRTGRTNNGWVYVVSPQGNLLPGYAKPSLQERVSTLAQNGIEFPENYVSIGIKPFRSPEFYSAVFQIEQAVLATYGTVADDIATTYPRNIMFIQQVFMEFADMVEEDPENTGPLMLILFELIDDIIAGFRHQRRIPEDRRMRHDLDRGYIVDSMYYLLDPDWSRLFPQWVYQDWYEPSTGPGVHGEYFWSYTAVKKRYPIRYE